MGTIVGLDICGEEKSPSPHARRPIAVTFKIQHSSRSLQNLLCVSYNSSDGFPLYYLLICITKKCRVPCKAGTRICIKKNPRDELHPSQVIRNI